jgi:uncharacterized protein (DUF1015 family)
MAEIQPLQTLRYDLDKVPSLEAVIAPPYDVIDEPMREALLAKSPFNVVEVDLPRDYEHAARTVESWREQGVLVQEDEPALWALRQDFTAPNGQQRTRTGFFARVRVEEYGPGRIRPHERTHPGPKEDRLRLTRATKSNLSPIFSLFPDQGGAAREALESATSQDPFVEASDEDGTTNILWRIGDPDAIASLQSALAEAELLIADGHHRYETARVYAEEIGGEGDHRYVLMFLCALEDRGLTVFPTHRLLADLKDDTPKQLAIRDVLKDNFDIEEVPDTQLEGESNGQVSFGYMDSFHKQGYRCTLKDQSVADAALEGHSDAYRRLDTAVLEALVLRGALNMSDDDIDHKRGLDYSKSFADALDAVRSERFDAGFFMRATPVDQVREVAGAGESMPPKSTYFFPKVPTGLVFNLLG